MPHRILIAMFSHETNRFATRPTDLAAFQDRIYLCGSEVIDGLKGTNTEIAGFLDVAEIEGWEVIPTIAAAAGPSGLVTKEAESVISNLILEPLQGDRPDGVLLALHGAMVTETADDGEGALIGKLRAILGPSLPILVTLDLHANVTDQMAALATALISYHTYPHIDLRERGQDAARLLARCLKEEVRPRTVVSRAPLLLGCDDGRTTGQGQMIDHLAVARRLELEEPGVLKVSVNAGFVDADIFEAGPSVTVTGDGSSPRWQELADDMMREIWRRRDEESVKIISPEEAIDIAVADQRANRDQKGAVVIADFADNPGAGAYGDATRLLELMIESELEDAAFGGLFDPEAAGEMHAAGVGAELTLRLGGKTDPNRGGGPLTLTGCVVALGAQPFVYEGPMLTGIEGYLGPTACFRVRGIDILVTSINAQMLDLALFRAGGIQPENKAILAVKSQQHFRGAFAPLARKILVCDTGALSSNDLSLRDFRHVRRPIYPLDTVEWDG